MRKIRRVMAVILTMICVLMQTASVYASDVLQSDDTANALYMNQYSETIEIDEHYYTYEFYMANNGNRGMDIIDNTGETIARLV